MFVCTYMCGLFNINDEGNRTIASVGFFLYHLFSFFPSEADINYLIGPFHSDHGLNHSLHKQATLKLYYNRERPGLSLTSLTRTHYYSYRFVSETSKIVNTAEALSKPRWQCYKNIISLCKSTNGLLLLS